MWVIFWRKNMVFDWTWRPRTFSSFHFQKLKSPPSFPISHLWYHLESSCQPKSLPPTRTIAFQVLFPLSLSESIEKLASSPFPWLRATQAQQTQLATIIFRNGCKPPNRFSRRMGTQVCFLRTSLWTLSAIPHPLLLQNLSQEGRTQGDFGRLFFTYLRSTFQLWPLRGFPGRPLQMTLVYRQGVLSTLNKETQ